MGKYEDIRDAALDIVSEEGVRGLTLPRLFEHAHTGSGTFYHYFKDREDLMDAVFRHCFDVALRALEPFDAEALSFSERFEKLCVGSFRACRLYPREFSFLYGSTCGYISPDKDCCRLSPFLLALTHLLVEAHEAGELNRSFPPVVLARMIQSMIASALWGHEHGLVVMDEAAALQFSRGIWASLI